MKKKRTSWLIALLLQRCPRCRTAPIFRGFITMNDPCPLCDLVFEREPGYLLGAMYFSYFMSVGLIASFFYLLKWLLPPWHEMVVALVTMIIYLPFVPFVFRYSRVIWIYYDRLIAPSSLSDHQGWLKWREQRASKPDVD
jgi:uncharacterized protein (DUF983 family)